MADRTVVTLHRERIMELLDESPIETDFVIKLYREIYGAELWEQIDTIKGWPRTNVTTAHFISKLIREKYNRMMGEWFNTGFGSVDGEHLKDFEVELAEYTIC